MGLIAGQGSTRPDSKAKFKAAPLVQSVLCAPEIRLSVKIVPQSQ